VTKANSTDRNRNRRLDADRLSYTLIFPIYIAVVDRVSPWSPEH